jgi:hypothetical protein
MFTPFEFFCCAGAKLEAQPAAQQWAGFRSKSQNSKKEEH